MSPHTCLEVSLFTSKVHVGEKETLCHICEREGMSGLPPSSEVAICVLARYLPSTGCALLGWDVLYRTGLGPGLGWAGQGFS